MFDMQCAHSDGYESLKVDRAAWDSTDKDQLMMISFVASSSVVKSVLAAVRSKKTSTYIKQGYRRILPLHEKGYTIVTARLPKFDQVHVVMVAKDCRIVFGNVREQLGKFLLSKQTTTPMLPQWVPIVVEHILEIGAVTLIDCVGFDAYKIEFDDFQLDEIVSELLRERKIRIHVSKQPC